MDTFSDVYQKRLELLNLGDSDSNNESDEEIIEPELITKQKFLIISSIDRDWVNLNTSTHNYNVKLSVVGNSMEYKNQNFHKYSGQTDNAFIINNLKNIKSIGIKSLIIPNLVVNIKDRICTRFFQNTFENSSNITHSHYNTIKDLPFLLIKISEINGIWDSTNNEINNSLSIMIPRRTETVGEGIDKRSSNVIDGISRELRDKYFCYYNNIEDWKKIYYPNVLNSLNMLSIQILDDRGNPIKILSDYLDIKFIQFSKQTNNNINYINKITIRTQKFFSYYEYQEGDIIIMKNIKFNSNKSNSIFNLNYLEEYLNKNELTITSVILNNNTKKMSNQFTINFPHKLNMDTGNLEIDQSYLKTNQIPDDDILFTSELEDSGKILNKMLQNTITLSVETLEHDASIITNNIV
jgi:hypothetical protein